MSTDASRLQQDYRSRLGVWVFLASELMFFGPVFFSYLVGRHGAPVAFMEAGRHTDLLSGTLNTALLLTSSLAMALAVQFVQDGDRRRVRRALDVTLALGLAFLAVKGLEYFHDWQESLIPGPDFHLEGASDQAGAQLFFVIYFISTLLHSVHLIVGLLLVAWCRLSLGEPRADSARRRLDGVALYWHFVDLIWIFLFPALYLMGRAS